MDGSELLRRKSPRVRTVDILLTEAVTTDRDRLIVEIRRQEAQEEWDGGDMKSPLPRLRQELAEAEQVIIVRFGKVVGDPVVDPGLHFKIPFIDTARRFDKRWLAWDGEWQDLEGEIEVLPNRIVDIQVSVDAFLPGK